MKTYIIYGITGLLSLLSISCKKDKLMLFDQKSKVYIYKTSLEWLESYLTRDSMTYSFATGPAAISTDTVFVPLRIMGDVENYDRKVNYELMETSLADKESYELLPALIKANKFDGNIPIRIKRTAALEKTEGRLWLRIIASEDFEPGIIDQLTYLIKINDFLSRPATWNDYYFGDYSTVKYDFIIKITGYIKFDNYNQSETLYIAQTCKNALREYEELYGPLYDENGVPVTFP